MDSPARPILRLRAAVDVAPGAVQLPAAYGHELFPAGSARALELFVSEQAEVDSRASAHKSEAL
jgi:hypothetical protein